MANVAVVILNYNGRNYLEQFLPPLIKHSTEAEIIIADNASTDDSIEFLNSKYPELTLIVLAKNFGYAGGYNKALDHVKADYLVLLNSDVEVTNDWLNPMITFLNKNPDYVACQPKILDAGNRNHFEYAGAAGGFLDALAYPFCRGRIFNTVEEDHGQYDDAIDISWASGACLMVRSSSFSQVGGFDPDFFAHMEEIDLCWRLQMIGYKIRCVSEATVFHVGGGTLSKTNARKTYLNFRNGLFLLIKNLPLFSLVWKFPLRILLDWIAILKFLFEGSSKHAIAIVRAHFAVLFSLIKMLRKRKAPNNPTIKVTKPYSVVLNYFIKRKTRYSEY